MTDKLVKDFFRHSKLVSGESIQAAQNKGHPCNLIGQGGLGVCREGL